MAYGEYESSMQIALKNKIDELTLRAKTSTDSTKEILENLLLRCRNIELKLASNKEMTHEEKLTMRDLLLTRLHTIDDKILDFQRQKLKTMTAMRLLDNE